MINNNIDFVSTDIDLDRDTPTPCPLTNYYHPQTSDSRLWLFDDASDLVDDDFDVDVDENGPFITSSSDHFDNYCDTHPDFNAALNGHWEYI